MARILPLAVVGLLVTLTSAPVAAPLSAPDALPAPAFVLNVVGKENVGGGVGHGGGHRIFVPLHGDCRIDLTEGEFGVSDGDCVNDPRAGFTLPNPDPEDDGVSSYAIYVRALGKPGGSASFTTCMEDNGDTWCSTESVFVARAGGQSPGYDVSREMLTICHDRDGDGQFDREQIFDDGNRDYYWSYENQGLRLAQLRFYPMQVSISGPCAPAA